MPVPTSRRCSTDVTGYSPTDVTVLLSVAGVGMTIVTTSAAGSPIGR